MPRDKDKDSLPADVWKGLQLALAERLVKCDERAPLYMLSPVGAASQLYFAIQEAGLMEEVSIRLRQRLENEPQHVFRLLTHVVGLKSQS